MPIEFVKVGHRLKWQYYKFPMAVKCFEFSKCKVYTNREGEVTSELPFTEDVILISKWGADGNGIAMWLTPDQFFILKGLFCDSENLGMDDKQDNGGDKK